MAKVSVIIPMYNAKPYIRQCIQSVIHQTYSEWEILVIDDGSTDQSLKICEELKQKDNRIRIFTQENKGVSIARNRGLEASLGEYIFFLDSDDAIHPCLLEESVREAELCRADLTFCLCVRLNAAKMNEKKRIKPEDRHDVQWIIGEKVKSREWFYNKFEQELSCIGGKMIRRNFIGKQRFNENFSRGEDTIFIHDLICKGMRMAYLNLEWYFYRINSENIIYSGSLKKNWQQYKVSKLMRDKEYQTGHFSWAMKCEEKLIWNILSNYLITKNIKDKKDSLILKEIMIREIQSPLYRNLPVTKKTLFYSLFFGCSYILPIRILWRIKQKIWRFCKLQ